ncbi:MAG: hypothetical protein KBC84_01320 [Proteobacteria bacterium]|nr:hypothetical protein [Pseudomonadota bacterium]
MKLTNFYFLILLFSFCSCSSDKPDPIVLIEQKDVKLRVLKIEGELLDNSDSVIKNADVVVRTSSYMEEKNTGSDGIFVANIKMFPEEFVTFTFKTKNNSLDAHLRNNSFPKGVERMKVKFVAINPGKVIIKEIMY